MGNVIGAGLGQNPAAPGGHLRWAAYEVGATTVNKVCGSGLKAVMLADQAIRLGDAGLVVAGGMESMSRAPYLLTRAREGYRLGHGELLDAMIHDGLWDVYGQKSMGVFGDLCASTHGISREAQDDFAVRSFNRARKAIAEGVFRDEIVPVAVTVKGKTTLVSEDEGPAKFDEAEAPGPQAGLRAGGALRHDHGRKRVQHQRWSGRAAGRIGRRVRTPEGSSPWRQIVGAATHSQKPDEFTTAPVYAIQKLLEKVGWTIDQVDLFEINEAFAVVALFAERQLKIPPEKLNIFGGAVALGHPIGCSGARILVTLLNALKRTGGRRGVASLCIGGGEAVAMAIETFDMTHRICLGFEK